MSGEKPDGTNGSGERARFARLKQLVAAAAAVPAEARASFLDEQAGDDHALRVEVADLLEAALRADGFLVPPGATRLDGLRGATLELTPGTCLGPFRVLRPLGRGGMGMVYEAEQDEPRRRVALKVVHLGPAGSEAAQRFRREAELLGRLRHPAIGQVHAAGVDRVEAGGLSLELPWLALELVEDALPLTEHARRAGLDLRARVVLLASVADAVHHGHQKGVLHRDLKADNVLVDGSGRPKVIDFGIARALGEGEPTAALRTRPGEVLGTLASMSPEQVAGDVSLVDTRTDVWALGVLLYELVTGRPPFEVAGRSLAAVARSIQEDSPPRPRELAPELDADLELIVLCALRKDPAERYGSAAGLRDDLEAWCSGAAIRARPPSLRYQLRVLARRHRAAALAGASIFAMAVLAASISLLFALRAARAAREASQRSLAEAAAREHADAEARRARRAEARAEQRSEELRGLSRALVFDVFDAVADLPGGTSARRLLADTAVATLEGLERDAAFAPGSAEELGLGLELAQGWLRLGEVLGGPGSANLGDRAGAEQAVARSAALVERLQRSHPESAAAEQLLLRVRLQQGTLALAAGRGLEALELLSQARAAAQAACTERPEDAGARRLLGNAAHLEAGALLRVGRREAAAAGFELAAALARERRSESRDEPTAARDLGLALVALANLELEAGRAPGAAPLLEEALAALAEAPAAEGRQARADAAVALERLGDAQLALGREDAAQANLERSVELRRRLCDTEPEDVDALRRLSLGCERLGVLLQRRGRSLEATARHAEALAATRELVARLPADRDARRALGVGLQYRGECELALGHEAEAERSFTEALAIQEQLVEAEPDALDLQRDRIGSLSSLAGLALSAGDGERALRSFERLEALVEAALLADPEHAWTRRMQLVAACDVGMASRALGEDPGLPVEERRTYLERGREAVSRGASLYAALESLGLLQPGDDRALAAMLADGEACEQVLAALE